MQSQIDPGSEKERRKFPRYRLQDGTIAFFGSKPSLITNISPAGMAVNYIVLGDEEDIDVAIDLFSPKTETYLRGISGKVVREECPDPAPFYSILRVRKVCVMFNGLSSEQQSKLNKFISVNKRQTS